MWRLRGSRGRDNIAAMEQVELLAPAKDLECGLAAIACGADAVYIGAERFGARAKAGNPLPDLERLIDRAHTFWVRVYVTVNTLLFDRELDDAVRLIHGLHRMGADGVIVQDVGLLECDLPPIPLIASTQMDNDRPEKVLFLERVGFTRAILARELSLDEIREIRRKTTLELECFVHGALCVCASGQCFLSYALGGRSGNRGECAQPCRRRYSLIDGEGSTVVRDRYLLSLKDLNRSDQLEDLLDAGVRCFKIEGRLRDKAYVANVVGFYRRRLDAILERRAWARTSSGRSDLGFEPDLHKTFNRGYTDYFLKDRGDPAGSIDTPKMVGPRLGRVASVRGRALTLDGPVAVECGDGLAFFDGDNELRGTLVNAVQGRTLIPDRMDGIHVGTVLYRNHDHAFLRRVLGARPVRRIGVQLRLEQTQDGLALTGVDEDGNSARATAGCENTPARDPGVMEATVRRQLARTGRTPFLCSRIDLLWERPWFVPVALLNGLRRKVLEGLAEARAAARPVKACRLVPNDVPYGVQRLSYLGNVLNRKAAAFYRRHGVTEIEPAAESGLDMRGRKVMTTRYCILDQLGCCIKRGGGQPPVGPLSLVDEDGRSLHVRIDCSACGMEIHLQSERTG
ncbi:MAG: U32 family peptidase [Phycisphaerae bacterium]|nr:U32 family peptidase [Phycisphaerae bacterium]